VLLEEDEQHRADGLRLHPWVPTPKFDVIELLPEVVTGRAFRLERHDREPEGAAL